MSATSDAISAPVDAASAASPSTLWNRVEQRLLGLSEYLNPILVKESRQALKSRQFITTFILVMLAAWGWTTFALGILGPEAEYAPAGPMLFIGYFLILAFPLLVVVPFGAYRSLSAEWEERTFELLSITNLTAYQIVAGKLASASVQMLVYFSAIAPCLAFTYLLRGIDLLTIGLMIGWLFVASVGLCVGGLYMATSAVDKYRQMAQQIAVVVGLLGAFWTCVMITLSALNEMFFAFDDAGFWQANLALLSVAVSFFVLGFQAAAVGLNFQSSNRSTPLRITAIAQHALLSGWVAWAWVGWSEVPMLIAYLAAAGGFWFVAGAYMTGEPAVMSPRVKRDLPQSDLGRAFLTWLNPGPGTGYMLAIVAYCSGLIFALTLMAGASFFGASPQVRSFSSVMAGMDPFLYVLRIGLAILAYMAFYLALGRVLLALASLAQPVGPNGRVALYAVLVAIGVAGPIIIQWSSPLRNDSYTLLQTTNPFWTIYLLCFPATSGDPIIAVTIIAILAVIFAGLQLPSIGREVANVRIVAPRRVLEEDAAALAAQAPPPQPKDPWDDVTTRTQP